MEQKGNKIESGLLRSEDWYVSLFHGSMVIFLLSIQFFWMVL